MRRHLRILLSAPWWVSVCSLLLLVSPWLNQTVIVPAAKYSAFLLMQRHIQHFEQKVDTLQQLFLDDSSTQFHHLRSNANALNVSYQILQGQKLLHWNSTGFQAPVYYQEFYRPTYLNTNNGAYLVFSKAHPDTDIHLLISYKLTSQFSISNAHLKYQFAPIPWLSPYVKINSPAAAPYVALLSSGQYAFGFDYTFNELPITFAILFLICWIITLRFLYRVLRFGRINWVLFINACIVILCWWTHYPQPFFHSFLFDSSLFFGQVFHISLGDMVGISTLFLTILWARPAFLYKKAWLWFGTLQFLLLFLLWFIFETIINSVIPFDLSNVFAFNWASYAQLGILVMLLLAGMRLFQPVPKLSPKIALCTTLPFVLVIAIACWVLQLQWWFMILPFVLVLLLLLFQQKQLSSTFRNIAWIMAMGLVVMLTQQYLKQKETTLETPLLGAKLVNSQDVAAEFILANIESRIQQDPYIKSYFESPLVFKRVIDERLQKLYFPPYFNKYSVNIEYQTLLAGNATKKAEAALAEKRSIGGLRVGDYFVRLPTQNGLLVYEGTVPVEAKAHSGLVQIKLREKTAFAESVYPELLAPQASTPSAISSIPYALYIDQKLHESTIPNAPENLQQAFKNFSSAIVQKPDQHSVVLLQQPSFSVISLFSGLGVIIALILTLVWLNALYLWLSKKRETRVVSSLRIRVVGTVFGTVFLAFLVQSVLTITQTKSKYEDANRENLLQKSRKISQFLEMRYGESLQRQDLNGIIAELSTLFETDIDLFDQQGLLVASTQQALYTDGVFPEYLPGNVQGAFNQTQLSEILVQRQVGQLPFLSAYESVQINQQPYVLHLAYFSSQRELQAEIQSFSLRLFNLYLLSLVVLGLISATLVRYITQPLRIIKMQLGNTELTGDNKHITWHSDDEIGELVAAYNRMTDKLKDSAQQLAESKQQEAWREMAQQVAHEIKNPLTPMKLNIQQLQRAWKDEHQNLPKIFERVTAVLIKQIDSLSHIASAFSSFAKMPTSTPERVNIPEVIEEVMALYKADVDINWRQFDGEAKFAMIDRDQFFRAINNLVKNGIQAVPHDRSASIRFSLKHDEHNIYLQVEDNGSGIAEEHQAHVFKPKFSTKTSGMGLGLAMAYKTVHAAGGSISFESTPNKGTAFNISLPIDT